MTDKNIIAAFVLVLLVSILAISVRGIKWKEFWEEFLKLFDWYDWWS